MPVDNRANRIFSHQQFCKFMGWNRQFAANFFNECMKCLRYLFSLQQLSFIEAVIVAKAGNPAFGFKSLESKGLQFYGRCLFV